MLIYKVIQSWENLLLSHIFVDLELSLIGHLWNYTSLWIALFFFFWHQRLIYTLLCFTCGSFRQMRKITFFFSGNIRTVCWTLWACLHNTTSLGSCRSLVCCAQAIYWHILLICCICTRSSWKSFALHLTCVVWEHTPSVLYCVISKQSSEPVVCFRFLSLVCLEATNHSMETASSQMTW